MNDHSVKSKILGLSIAIIGLGFFIPAPVFAGVIYSQSNFNGFSENINQSINYASTLFFKTDVITATTTLDTFRIFAKTATTTVYISNTSDLKVTVGCHKTNSFAFDCGAGNGWLNPNSSINMTVSGGATIDTDGEYLDFTTYEQNIVLAPGNYYTFRIAIIPSTPTIYLGGYDSNVDTKTCLYETNTDSLCTDNLEGNIEDLYFYLYDSPPDPLEAQTRIISLDPAHGSTTPSGNDVFFRARAYIADEPSFWDTIEIKLHYTDMNSILSLISDYEDVVLYSGAATTTGIFDYSTTTDLADGNYTVTFQLKNSTLGGLLNNPFGGDNQAVTNQFIVGTSTFLGNLNTNFQTDVNAIYGSMSATTTSSLVNSCNPFSGQWGTINCLSFLLIPQTDQIREVVEDFKTDIMAKAPWGYAVRLFAIVSGNGTSTPPTLSLTIPNDSYFSANLRGLTLSLDPWGAVSDGSILDQADGFGEGNLMDTFMPYWKIIVYGFMIFGLVHKIFGLTTSDIRTSYSTKPKGYAMTKRDAIVKNIES